MPSYRSRPPIGARINTAHRLAHGLLYLAPLTEGAGIPIDLVSRLPLTPIGSANAWIDTPLGKAVSLPSTASFDITTPSMGSASGNRWTFFAQCAPHTSGNVILGYNGTGSNWYMQLFSGSPGSISFTGSSVSGSAAQPLSVLFDGNPHTFVVTNDNGAISIYIDAIPAGTGSIGGTNALNVGQATGKTWHLMGGYGGAGGFDMNGWIAMSGLATDVWSAADVGMWHANPGILFARPQLLYKPAAAGSTYTLSPTAGAYSVAGASAPLTAARKVAPATGAYALTGTAAPLTRALRVAPAVGAYTLAGTGAPLTRGLRLAPAPGSYAVSGTAAALARALRVAPATGAYAVTGLAASLARALKLAPTTGVYVLTGTDASLSKSSAHTIAAATGAYVVTGNAAALTVNRKLAPQTGTYAIAGTAAQLARALRLLPATGTYTVSGLSAATVRQLRVAPATGIYNVLGRAATVLRTARLAPATGVYVVLGTPATLTHLGGAHFVRIQTMLRSRYQITTVVQSRYRITTLTS